MPLNFCSTTVNLFMPPIYDAYSAPSESLRSYRCIKRIVFILYSVLFDLNIVQSSFDIKATRYLKVSTGGDVIYQVDTPYWVAHMLKTINFK